MTCSVEVTVVHAQADQMPTITVTDEHVTAEDKNKGAYEQLKELLESDKQQQVHDTFLCLLAHHSSTSENLLLMCTHGRRYLDE